MKVKLYEAMWKHHISGELATRFHKSIEEGDVESVIGAAIALLSKCEEFFDAEEDDYVIDEIEELIDEFENCEEEAEEVDFLLDELYDFCDGYNIFIDLDDEEVEPEEHEEETMELETVPEEEFAEIETAEEEK